MPVLSYGRELIDKGCKIVVEVSTSQYLTFLMAKLMFKVGKVGEEIWPKYRKLAQKRDKLNTDEFTDSSYTQKPHQPSDGDKWTAHLKKKGAISVWAKNVAKRQRDSGQEYVAIKSKVVPAVRVGSPCTCLKKCFEAVGEENIC
ncbi:hypothetical protein E2C01_029268 [Portunus trituberculatus]|uniref:Uncharacterized protein n=1 Tax=Portunus trituberculatus TaxID=210409 RepID=A0A5B7EMU9_PORTR|nr:hypothetical protein [Portunus trituberculatus]